MLITVLKTIELIMYLILIAGCVWYVVTSLIKDIKEWLEIRRILK